MQFLKWTFSGLEIIMLVSCATKSVGLVESLLLGQIDVYEKNQGQCIYPQGAPCFIMPKLSMCYNINIFLLFALCHEVMMDSIAVLYHRLLKNFVVMEVTYD